MLDEKDWVSVSMHPSTREKLKELCRSASHSENKDIQYDEVINRLIDTFKNYKEMVNYDKGQDERPKD